MDFRKIILVGVVWIFSNWVSGQVDTTNFSFFTELPDSNNNTLSNLVFEFGLEDISGYHTISVELVYIENERSMSEVYNQQFLISELENSEFNSGGTIILNLAPRFPDASYVLTVKVLDSFGHQVTTYTKIMTA